MQPWYRLDNNEGKIEFQPHEHRYWPPEIIRACPLRLMGHSPRRWIITGPGAMWMYAHVAAILTKEGYDWTTQLAGAPGTSNNLDGCKGILKPVPEKGSAVLEMHLTTNERLTDNAIAELLTPTLEQLRHSASGGICELCLTGQANGYAYALAASAAVQGRVKKISCWTPADGLVVVYDESGQQTGERLEPPDWLFKLVSRPRTPVVVGVLGDPNCGKSVFSLALNHFRSRFKGRECIGWRLDCDGAAPTTDWYLSLLSEDQGQAKRKREAIKLSWTEEMENQIAARVRRLRDFFDVGIADLPGGNHRVRPPQRVPPHREVILREVDTFILIERIDCPSEQAWRAALEPHQLADRIKVVLTSTDPDGPPCLHVWRDGEGIWRGEITGLDRNKRPDELVNGYRVGMESLWTALVPSECPKLAATLA
ncbi:MAG: hypothetical protein NZ703_05295 [Gemmataceae bacterium]|nr:hypothetical protein [Gemmataceae bacterium]